MDDTLVPTTSQQNAPAASAADSSAGGAKPATQVFHDKDGPSFSDLLDIINPLQHIPIINTLYQKLTGDEEGAAADVAGGALWGGLIGVGAALVDLAVRSETGRSIGGNVLALLDGEDDAPQTAIAKTETPDPAPEAIVAKPAVAVAALDNGDATDGPARQGAFLVFGDAGAAAAPTPPATPSLAAPVAADNTAMPSRQGDFLVFGGGGAAGITAPATPNPAGTASIAAATPAATAVSAKTQGNFMIFGADQAPATAPPPLPEAQTAAAAAVAPLAAPARTFPIPARRGPAAPSTIMAMPTTGPAALPGHGRTRAINTTMAANDTAAEAVTPPPPSSTSTPPTGQDPSWFVNAVNAAMDKYQRASMLAAPVN